MDFNQSFQAYDTLDGANCQTVLPEIMTQREAAIEAVKQIGLPQIREMDMHKFAHRVKDGQGGLSEKNVKDIMSVINSVCKYGAAVYGVKQPPLMRWRYSNISKPIQVFTREEQKILEDFLTRNITPHKLGILICLYTGMRLGEICALSWQNVDLERKVFHIEKTVQRIYTVRRDAL